MCRQNSTFKNCKVLVNDSIKQFDKLNPQQLTISGSYTFRERKGGEKENLFFTYSITDLNLSYKLSQSLLLTPTRT